MLKCRVKELLKSLKIDKIFQSQTKNLTVCHFKLRAIKRKVEETIQTREDDNKVLLLSDEWSFLRGKFK